MTRETVANSRVERAAAFRQTLCLALGGEDAIKRHGSEIIQSAGSYMRERRVGLKNKARSKKLKQIVALCDDLMVEIDGSRDWLDATLDPVRWGGIDVEAIIADDASPLRALRDSVQAALDEVPDQGAKEAVYFRRRFWIRLAMIYEDATERRAATSKNKDGNVQGNFVRLVIAVTEYINPVERITSDMVDQFIDWYRSSDSGELRDEVAEFRMLAAAVGPAG